MKGKKNDESGQGLKKAMDLLAADSDDDEQLEDGETEDQDGNRSAGNGV